MAKQDLKVTVEVAGENGTRIKIELIQAHYDFCVAYIKHRGIATRAYLEVYPNSSPAAARSSASELLTNPNILSVIEHFQDQYIMNAKTVLFHLSDLANASYVPFINYGKDGKQFPFIDLSSDDAKENMHLVKDMKMVRERRLEGTGEEAEEWETETIELKLHDRHGALRDMARFHKLLVDRIENTGHIIQIPWDQLTPEQTARLHAGADPSVIMKEINERKQNSSAK